MFGATQRDSYKERILPNTPKETPIRKIGQPFTTIKTQIPLQTKARIIYSSLAL